MSIDQQSSKYLQQVLIIVGTIDESKEPVLHNKIGANLIR